MSAGLRRVQVPVSEDTQLLLDALRDPGSASSESVRTLLGELPASEARIMARLVSLGAERVREAQRAAGYAALAESMSDPEERAYEEAADAHRRRQAATWADA
ncbi:MAG TPA: hypothetical protein VFD41_01730 [Actinomycetales bacterium]|nr:hypothetical protein [Actinomycetales bacterium]